MHESPNFLQLLCTVVLRIFMDEKVSHETKNKKKDKEKHKPDPFFFYFCPYYAII